MLIVSSAFCFSLFPCPSSVHASFQASPVQFAHDPNPARIFIGKMESSLFGIELDTGNIVGEFGSTPSSGVQSAESVVPSSCGVRGQGLGRGRRRKKSGDAEMDAAELEAMLDEMEAGHSKHAESCPQNLLYITRTGESLESTSRSRRVFPRCRTRSHSLFLISALQTIPSESTPRLPPSLVQLRRFGTRPTVLQIQHDSTLPSPPSGVKERRLTITTRCSLLVGRLEIGSSRQEFLGSSQKDEVLDSGESKCLIRFREPQSTFAFRSHLASEN